MTLGEWLEAEGFTVKLVDWDDGWMSGAKSAWEACSILKDKRIKELEEALMKIDRCEPLNIGKTQTQGFLEVKVIAAEALKNHISDGGGDDVWCRTCRGAGAVGLASCLDCVLFSPKMSTHPAKCRQFPTIHENCPTCGQNANMLFDVRGPRCPDKWHDRLKEAEELLKQVRRKMLSREGIADGRVYWNERITDFLNEQEVSE